MMSEDGKEHELVAAEAPNEPYRSPDDFDIIAEEFTRQYGVKADFSQAQVDKIGIMLGFILLILVQISLTNDLINKPFNSDLGLVLFDIGFLLIGLSAIIGMAHYFVKEYPIGYNVVKLLNHFKSADEINYKTKIAGAIYNAQLELDNICKKRALSMKVMMIIFSIGVLLVVTPRMMGW